MEQVYFCCRVLRFNVRNVGALDFRREYNKEYDRPQSLLELKENLESIGEHDTFDADSSQDDAKERVAEAPTLSTFLCGRAIV